MSFIKYIINLIKAYFNRKSTFEIPKELFISIKKLPRTSDKEIYIKKDFLTLNKYSRPGRKRKGVLGLEAHWVAAPGQDWQDVRQWFELRKGGKWSFGSTHFCVGLKGDLIQMIPEDEIAFSSGAKRRFYKDGVQSKYGIPPYYNTLAIEMCHPDASGKLKEATYKSVINWFTYMCKKYNLIETDIERHWDLTGKYCPKWYVDNPSEWHKLRNDVGKKLRS